MKARTLLGTFLIAMLVGRFALSAEGERPNVVLTISDDHGWDAEQGNRAKLSPYELGILSCRFDARSNGKMHRDCRALAKL